MLYLLKQEEEVGACLLISEQLIHHELQGLTTRVLMMILRYFLKRQDVARSISATDKIGNEVHIYSRDQDSPF